MKKMKAFLAAITLLLCVSNVYAEEGDYVASIGSTQYETLDEAIENQNEIKARINALEKKDEKKDI